MMECDLGVYLEEKLKESSEYYVNIKKINAKKCPYGWRGYIKTLIKSVPKYILKNKKYDVRYIFDDVVGNVLYIKVN